MEVIDKHRFYSILHDADRQCMTLDWTQETANMEDADWNDAALQFARRAREHSTPFLRVVTTNFKHAMSAASGEFRKQHVLPVYEQAGVTKIAFEVGAGGHGPPTSVDGGRETRSFETSQEIWEWFSET